MAELEESNEQKMEETTPVSDVMAQNQVETHEAANESSNLITDEDVEEAVSEIAADPVMEETHHEEAEIEHESEEEEELDLHDMDFEALAALFKSFVAEEKHLKSRKNFKKFRDRFREIFDEKRKAARAAYDAVEGEKEKFEFVLSGQEAQINSQINDIDKHFAELKRKNEQEIQENFLKKNDILDELKNLIENEQDISKARETFNQLIEKWNSIGKVPPLAAEDLYRRYNHYRNIFYQSLQLHRDLFKIELQKNLENKLRIVQGVESLMKIPSIKKSVEFLQDYHKQWRETGPVPRSKNEELWERFKKATDAVYQRRDEFVAQLNEQRLKNYEAKQAFVAEMESIASQLYSNIKEIREGDKLVQEIEKKWKTVGRAPQALNDEIWQKFREARKAFVQKKNELFKAADAELHKNMERKKELIKIAESLIESTDWKNTANKFIQLQQEWKGIGPVPHKHSEDLWQKFRAAADTFFNNKEKQFAAAIEQEKANLEAKKEIIKKLAEYVHTEVVQDSVNLVNELKKQWAEIGFVPYKEKQAIERAFDDAVKRFFEAINMSQSEGDKNDYKAKIDAIASAGDSAYNQLRQERQFLRTKAERLKEEMMQIENNLMFFGNSKNAEELKKPYIAKLEKAKKELESIDAKLFAVKHAIKPFEGK